MSPRAQSIISHTDVEVAEIEPTLNVASTAHQAVHRLLADTLELGGTSPTVDDGIAPAAGSRQGPKAQPPTWMAATC